MKHTVQQDGPIHSSDVSLQRHLYTELTRRKHNERAFEELSTYGSKNIKTKIDNILPSTMCWLDFS